jgi:hypothetical protein
MTRATVVKSMHIGRFGEFAVLGSHYLDGNGESCWYVALLREQDPYPSIHHVISGDLPDELARDERHAVIEAIRLWESQPISRPN